MMTLTPKLLQMQMDFETDSARRESTDWQLACEHNLHALSDYVDPSQAIVWQPGVRKRGPNTSGYHSFNVQLTTAETCTCQTFRLRSHCEHQAFIKRIQDSPMALTQDVPVKANDISVVINDSEEVA